MVQLKKLYKNSFHCICYRNYYNCCTQNCIFARFRMIFILCDFCKPIATGFRNQNGSSEHQRLLMWKTPNFIGSHVATKREKYAEMGGEQLGPSLRASSQGDCRILKYFLAPPFVTPTPIYTSGPENLLASTVCLAFSFSCGISHRFFLVNHSVHEQS